MKRSILVVDQSLDYCRWVTHALNGPMTEVLSALSTDEAIKFYTKYRFCLVIIDGVLAEQNKTRLLKILRETRVVPILALLPSVTSEKRTLFLRGGATAVLEKSCLVSELVAQTESLINLYLALNPEDGQFYTLAYGMDFIIDYMRHQLILDGEPIDMPRKEFESCTTRTPSQPGSKRGTALCPCLAGRKLLQCRRIHQKSYHEDPQEAGAIRKRLHPKCLGVGYSFSYPG